MNRFTNEWLMILTLNENVNIWNSQNKKKITECKIRPKLPSKTIKRKKDTGLFNKSDKCIVIKQRHGLKQ